MPCDNHEIAVESEGPTLIVEMDEELDLAAYPWDQCIADQMAKIRDLKKPPKRSAERLKQNMEVENSNKRESKPIYY